MGDGAVKFVTDSIEAGNSNSRWLPSIPAAFLLAPQVPTAVGRLGTSANKEVINTDF